MWILTVILVITSGAGNVHTTTAEFKTEQQCMSHGDNVSAAFLDGRRYREASFVCTFQE